MAVHTYTTVEGYAEDEAVASRTRFVVPFPDYFSIFVRKKVHGLCGPHRFRFSPSQNEKSFAEKVDALIFRFKSLLPSTM